MAGARGITPARLRRGGRVEVLSTGSFWRGGDERQSAAGAGLRKYDVALLLGRGIVDPPDEMNSRHAASHPELLDWWGSPTATKKCLARLRPDSCHQRWRLKMQILIFLLAEGLEAICALAQIVLRLVIRRDDGSR